MPEEYPVALAPLRAEFFYCLTQDSLANLAFLVRVTNQQGSVAKHVDDPGHSTGKAVYLSQGTGSEADRLASLCRHAQAMAYVGGSLACSQRLQVPAQGDPLIELGQFRPGEHVAELRLADQKDLQQFLVLSLQVGQQSELFEYAWFQILRLIDDHHHAPAGGLLVEEKTVELIDQLFFCSSR